MNLSLGLSKKQLKKMTERDKFSDYLPYIAYDQATHTYHNADGTRGFIWECRPLWFAGEDTARTLDGLFRAGIPEGSVMQFILYADPYIKPVTDYFLSLKTTQDPLLRRSMEEFAGYMNKGSTGLSNFTGIPLRNFRLFVTLSIPEYAQANIEELKASITDTLGGAYLCPAYLGPDELIRTLFMVFNDVSASRDDGAGGFPEHLSYDERVEIRKQVILSDTAIVNEYDSLRLGRKVCRVVTPKTLPRESSIISSNMLTGDIWGVVSDNNQIKTPFIITHNIIFGNLKPYINRKASLVLQQQAAGSFVPSLARRKDEYLWAVDEIERESAFLRVMPVAVVLGEDEASARESVARLKRIWEQQGYVMQEDRGIVPILFLSSLPFGLYNVGDNVRMMERDFILPVPAISDMLPVQADFQGSGRPQILFGGRKGELIGIDLFDEKAQNMNALIVGTSGGGKSFLMNHIVASNLAAGAYVRIIDIGRSYSKPCKIFGGKFIEFPEDSGVCLNPFSRIIKEDLDSELFTIASIFLQMVYSFSDTKPTETEASLVKDAVRWAYEREGQSATVDTVYEYLLDYRKHSGPSATETRQAGYTELGGIAAQLAYNLREFTSCGAYGKWFCGESTLDIANDRFVVLELEDLKPRKELFKVVLLQILNYVTQDLYLSDRSSPRMVIFDEAWQFFKEGGYLLDVIEEGDRRARKYKGSFTKVVQSILDLKRFKDIGDVILNNSAFKFYLQSSDFAKARKENLIDIDDFMFRIMNSIKLNRPKYSEIYAETPSGNGVIRLVVDPFLYYLYTSDPNDNSRLDRLVREGKSYLEAIEVLAGEKK